MKWKNAADRFIWVIKSFVEFTAVRIPMEAITLSQIECCLEKKQNMVVYSFCNELLRPSKTQIIRQVTICRSIRTHEKKTNQQISLLFAAQRDTTRTE